MKIYYNPQWVVKAREKIDEGFNKAYQKAVSDQDIEKLNKLFSEFQICMHFIEKCDSNLHKKRVLPQLVKQFQDEWGLILMLT